MSLNAYWCHLPVRIVGRSYDPPDPGEPTTPCGIYLAPTRGAAKRMLLSDHDRYVDQSEFVDVRTRLLERDVTDAPAGPLADRGDWDGEGDPPASPHYRLWGRVHEVEDHGGAACDCPTVEAGAA